ncbi:hypothetical protein BSQ44_05370 [Aquibium oceanicum]|uniref:Uncharacterized protein n=1 Tax=Aquibium oceanicum TaxID=1670800 RepID=A0A1L3SND9_9HYPH|nr:hypothetical protein BSQ44_05370 [Aquibium oceanicum]
MTAKPGQKRGRPFEKAGQQTAQRQPRERKLGGAVQPQRRFYDLVPLGQARALRPRRGAERSGTPNLEDPQGQADVRARLAWMLMFGLLRLSSIRMAMWRSWKSTGINAVLYPFKHDRSPWWVS